MSLCLWPSYGPGVVVGHALGHDAIEADHPAVNCRRCGGREFHRDGSGEQMHPCAIAACSEEENGRAFIVYLMWAPVRSFELAT